MIQKAPEIIIVPPGADEVSCDGGTGVFGHPVVYYTFDREGRAGCWYCGRRFLKTPVGRNAAVDTLEIAG